MNRKKVLVSLVLSIGIVVSVPSFNQVVHANTTTEIEAERSLLQSEIDEKKQELQEVQADLVELNEEIERVNESVVANEKMIVDTESEVIEKEAEIDELEIEVEALEEDIKRRDTILKDRAVALQKSGGSMGYLEVLFGSQSLSDFMDRVAMISKITQADSDLLERSQLDQEKLKTQKEQVENKLVDLQEVQEELKMMQGMILEQKEAHEANKEALQEREEKSKALVQELEIEDNELAQMLEAARVEAERRAAALRADAESQVTTSTQASGNIQQFSASPSGNVSGNVSNIISAGYKYIGNSSYKFGGGRNATDIANGRFDCSAYVAWAFRQEGISISSSTAGLASTGQKVSVSDMQPGDLVFFDTYTTNGHVAIYVGGNQFIGSQSSTGVAIASMNNRYWSNAFKGHVRRVTN